MGELDQYLVRAIDCGDCGVMPATSEDEQVARLAWNTRAPILSKSEMEMLEGME